MNNWNKHKILNFICIAHLAIMTEKRFDNGAESVLSGFTLVSFCSVTQYGISHAMFDTLFTEEMFQ